MIKLTYNQPKINIMKIRRRKASKKIILAVLTACIVVGSIAYIVYAQQNKQPTKPSKPITYSGPSEQDKKDAADNKKEVAAQQTIENQPSSSGSQKKQVNPVITNARQSDQQITINAYISGVFEEGGTCTAVATKGSSVVTHKSNAFADATTTSCAPIFIDRSAFPDSGSWSVVVNYSSNSAEGKSQATPLAIQ